MAHASACMRPPPLLLLFCERAPVHCSFILRWLWSREGLVSLALVPHTGMLPFYDSIIELRRCHQSRRELRPESPCAFLGNIDVTAASIGSRGQTESRMNPGMPRFLVSWSAVSNSGDAEKMELT